MPKINTKMKADGARFREQSANPSPNPDSGYQLLFVKSNGVFVIDSAGNVTGPFGAGGGGGSPGGSDKNIQYNNASSFGGIANNASATKKYLQQFSSGTPSLQQVADADLLVTDVTTNNATSSAHGFLKKLSNSATDFLDGTGNYDTVKDSDLSTSDITTNNVSTSKHGFTPKLPNDATKYLDGTGAYTVPAGGGGGGQANTTLWPDNFTGVTGTWGITLYGAQQMGYYLSNTATHANGDAFELTAFLGAGNYTLKMLVVKSSAYGKLDVAVDGSNIATGLDFYNAGELDSTHISASVTILTDGAHTIRFTVNGKNGSSSDFYILITRIDFIP